MSILNPWGELKALKTRLAAEEAAYVAEETEQQRVWAAKEAELDKLRKTVNELRADKRKADKTLRDWSALISDLRGHVAKLKIDCASLSARNHELTTTLSNSVRRDPVTGRYLKQGS